MNARAQLETFIIKQANLLQKICQKPKNRNIFNFPTIFDSFFV